MRPLTVIVFGFLLAATPLTATPSFTAPALQDKDTVREADQPRGERWKDRWQGRHHWLYDDAARDAFAQDAFAQDAFAQDAATDGHAANAQAHCRKVPVRVKRSDGSSVIRRINRCD